VHARLMAEPPHRIDDELETGACNLLAVALSELAAQSTETPPRLRADADGYPIRRPSP
jgi:hypothetical protein